jgi:centromeric protein E
MRGYNGTIFAYGQTTSGKTHTMVGELDNWGVDVLAVKDLLEYKENV